MVSGEGEGDEGSITIVLAMMIVVTSDSELACKDDEPAELLESAAVADVELTNIGRSVKENRSARDVVSLFVVSPPNDVELVTGDVVVMVIFMYCRFTCLGK